MNGQALETTEERDMGVAVSANLKPAAQCFKGARTAQTVLGRVGRAFRYGGRQVFIKPYKQYVWQREMKHLGSACFLDTIFYGIEEVTSGYKRGLVTSP